MGTKVSNSNNNFKCPHCGEPIDLRFVIRTAKNEPARMFSMFMGDYHIGSCSACDQIYVFKIKLDATILHPDEYSEICKLQRARIDTALAKIELQQHSNCHKHSVVCCQDEITARKLSQSRIDPLLD